MKLVEIKSSLQNLSEIAFVLPNGDKVPPHFHVTEIGKIDKHFIDCGGVIRTETKISFQLWNANDYDHRLHPEKLISIIEIAEKSLAISNEEVEVEFQGKQTIEKYAIDFNGKEFILTPQFTDCLAKDNCGIPEALIPSLNVTKSCCDPKSGCC